MSNPRIPHIKRRVDGMISSKDVCIKTIEVGTEEYELYASLIKNEKGKKSIGKGEASGILMEALNKGLITVDEGDGIWMNMLARKRKLPTSSFSEYLLNFSNYK